MKGRVGPNAAVLAGAAILLLTALVLRLCFSPAASAGRVNIYVEGRLEKSLTLPAEGELEYRIETPAGYNLLILDKTGVRVADADCPHKDCVSQGHVSADAAETRPLGRWIVCLPHKVSVELANK